jgi:hyperosmotically inducible periplasmic protein
MVTIRNLARWLGVSASAWILRRRLPVSPTSLTVRLLAALALAAPVVACDVFEGKQGVSGYAEDSNITNTIRSRFINDPVVHFGDVGVTTLNGNVRLSGRVNSDRERERAAQIANAVQGVRSVDNQIVVL